MSAIDTQALEGRKVLVTGAAGFIGFHLAEALLQAGAEVRGIDNLNAYYDVGLKQARLSRLAPYSHFVFVRADIGDYARIRAEFAGFAPDCVIHLAAQAGVRHSIDNPRAYVEANVDGFLCVLEACRAHPVRHLIYASSSSVYGTNTKVPFSEDDPVDRPASLYAATKRANELMASTYAHLYGIPATGLRFFTVYGPWGRPDMAYFSFTKAILEGRPIDVYNRGRMKRDFTYIDDVVAAILRLVDLPPEGTSADAGEGPAEPTSALSNIGNHTPVELERFIAAIETALGRKAERNYLPMQPGDVPATYADVDRLTKIAGFAPNTTIEDGIVRFVAWYGEYFGSP